MHRPGPLKLFLASLLLLPLLACDPAPPAGGSASAPPPAPAPAPAPAPGTGGTTELPAGELSGTAWQLAGLASGDGLVATPDNPSLYLVSFAPDGNLGITADCNQASGLWVSTQPGKIAVGGIVSTLAMCPEGSLSGDFIEGLQGATLYSFEGEALRLSTATGGSVLLTPI
jgi:heat shock protein HslJ